jgi:hypothetical protein
MSDGNGSRNGDGGVHRGGYASSLGNGHGRTDAKAETVQTQFGEATIVWQGPLDPVKDSRQDLTVSLEGPHATEYAEVLIKKMGRNRITLAVDEDRTHSEETVFRVTNGARYDAVVAAVKQIAAESGKESGLVPTGGGRH